MMRSPLFAVIGMLGLAACSAPSVDGVTSWVGLGSDEPQAPSEAPSQPQAISSPQTGSAPSAADLATSTEIHPALWPLQSPPPRDATVEAEVTRLLSQMTLEEKVGQMLQPDIKAITPADVTQYHLGSILNGGSAGPHGDLRAPAKDWLAAADMYYDASMADRMHIPVIWGIDAVHGHGHILGATLFPHNIALGAMRDPALVKRIGEITAQEIRITGQDWTFAPTVAVVRDDRWGRSYEGYAETPDLVAQNAAAMVEGLQGKPGSADFLKGGHVLASVKHFIGDGATDHGVNAGNATYGETALRDLFAPPYYAAIKAGAENIMVSYSSWRDKKMHVQKGLVDDVLVGRMGFPGFVISDYQAIEQVAGCTVSDCPQSVNAGVDMIMTAKDWKRLYANLVAQVRSGAIPMSRIDDAVGRILRVKILSGVMTAGRPSARPYAGRYDLLGAPDHRAVARQAVRESLVMLKNDGGLLPMSPRAHVLVAGNGADNMMKQTGGWTVTWQGTGTTRADYPGATTIYEGIKAQVDAAGGIAVLSPDGSFTEKPDVAIVVFGESAYAEGAGNIATLEYQQGDKRDLRLLQRLKSQGIPVVSVFLSGRPLYVTPEINASDAFVAAWQPGTEGEGVSDLLFAKPDGAVAYDFRGRLSFSWPRAPDQYALNVGSEPYYPLFAFGYGQTYSAPRNIGRLAEAAPRPAATPGDDRGLLFVDGQTGPGWLMTAGGKRVVSKTAQQGLTATRNGASGVDAVWATHVPVSLAISGTPADFSSQAADGLALSLTLKVDKAPTAPVVLAMGCGPLCGGKLDLTEELRKAEGMGRVAFSVPLSCLRAAGTDFGNVSTGFALTTSGSFKLVLSAVKIARADAPLSCESVPRVTAAAALPLGSRRDMGIYNINTQKPERTHVRKSRSKHPVGKPGRRRKR